MPPEYANFMLVIVAELTKVARNVAKPGEEVNFPGTKAEGRAEADKTAVNGEYFGVIVSACGLAVC
jgi:hypothetical protein